MIDLILLNIISAPRYGLLDLVGFLGILAFIVVWLFHKAHILFRKENNDDQTEARIIEMSEEYLDRDVMGLPKRTIYRNLERAETTKYNPFEGLPLGRVFLIIALGVFGMITIYNKTPKKAEPIEGIDHSGFWTHYYFIHPNDKDPYPVLFYDCF